MKMQSTSHITHLIMSLLTGGFWIPIWIIAHLRTQSHNQKVLFEALTKHSRG